MPNLTELRLAGVRVSGRGLMSVAQNKLTVMDASNTPMSWNAINNLQQDQVRIISNAFDAFFTIVWH